MSMMENSHRTMGRYWSAALRVCCGAVAELWPAHLNDTAALKTWRADPLEGVYCHRCGATMNAMGITDRGCAFCASSRLPWRRFVRLGAYKQPMSDWIVAMKFRKEWRRAEWFGKKLAEVLPSEDQRNSGRVAVCAVPLHWRRRWGRGFNQAELIAGPLGRERRWPVVKLLRRRRYSPPQTLLSPYAREANVRRCFAIRQVDLTGWTIWLIDDVKTSGATLRQCARLLRRAGAKQINVAVAAVADPKGRDFKAK